MEKLSFEEALSRLEEIVKILEDPETPLEKSVELFQEGVTLAKLCSDKLAGIEERVAKIVIDGKVKELPDGDNNEKT